MLKTQICVTRPQCVKLIVIFPPMTPIKKTDFPLLQKGVKITRETVTLETKILVIEKMEAGERRANFWLRNENYCRNGDNLYMQNKEISEVAEEVDLDNVHPVGVTEVLESHSQPLSNGEICDLAQKLTEQQKEDEEEEDRGTEKCRRRTY